MDEMGRGLGRTRIYVHDRIENADGLLSSHPLFPRVFDFVRMHDLKSLPPGRYEIAGDACYAMVQEADLCDADAARLEAHRDYIDIQLPVDGEECYGLAETPERVLDAADWSQGDVVFFDAPMRCETARPGEFFVFYPPYGAHAPCLAVSGRKQVRKVVIKVAKDGKGG